MSALEDIRKRAGHTEDVQILLRIATEQEVRIADLEEQRDTWQRIFNASEAELTQLRTERDRLLSETWRVPRDQWPAKADGYYMVRRWTRWHCGGNAIFREDITKLAEVAALTQRETRGQQIWPPVVDSANDSREGGDDERPICTIAHQ